MPSPAPIEVDYGGCASVLGTPPWRHLQCIYIPSMTRLRLWVMHARASEATIYVNGHPHPAVPYKVDDEAGQGGRGFTLMIDQVDAQQLEVRIPDASPWSLRLCSTNRQGPRLDADNAVRTEISDLEQRLRQGDRNAIPQINRQVALALSQGLLSNAVDLGLAVSHFAPNLWDNPNAAESILTALRPLAMRYPEGQAAWSIYYSHPLRKQGRLYDAAIYARQGSRYAVRTTDDELKVDGITSYALTLASLGYYDAASYWSREALRLSDHPRATDLVPDLLEIVAITNIRLKKAGYPHRDPRPYLDQMLALVGPDGANTNTAQLSAVHLAYAQLAMVEHHPRLALKHLRKIGPGQLTLARYAFARDLELSAHLELGSPAALLDRKLNELLWFAEHAPGYEFQWAAAVRQGQVLDNRGESEAAEYAYRQSEAILDDLLPLAALGGGAEAVAARRVEGTSRLLKLLLRGPAPRVDEALCVARQAHARLSRLSLLMTRVDDNAREAIRPAIERYRHHKRHYEQTLRRVDELPLDEQQRAQRDVQQQRHALERLAQQILSTPGPLHARPDCNELPMRRPGELLLKLYPLDNTLLVIFSDDYGSDYVQWPTDAPVEGLLEPLNDPIERSTRIRVLATGRATRLRPHMFPWMGTPLILKRPVVYGLELQPLSPAPAPSKHEPRAIVLGDVSALHAEASAQEASALLGAGGYNTRLFLTRNSRPEQFRQQLAHADHFYYAGHAYFTSERSTDRSRHGSHRWPPYPGGAATTPSYIPLDETAYLEVPDILMMGAVPSTVVLMGCSTGIYGERTGYGGQSLATAFLGSGAKAAIASTREVEANEAFLLGMALHDQLWPEATEQPGQWMQNALWTALDMGLPLSALANYRVFVP